MKGMRSLTASSEDQRAGLTITAICNPQNITHLEQDVLEELDRLLPDGIPWLLGPVLRTPCRPRPP